MDSEPEVIQLQPGPAISIRAQVSLTDLPSFFAGAFGELASCGSAQIVGPPFAMTASTSMRAGSNAVRVAIAPIGRVQPRSLPAGPAVQVRHIGRYDDVAASYTTIERWIADHQRSKAGPVREVYLSEPSVPVAEHVTLVIQPLAA